jgi:hypothetical protein
MHISFGHHRNKLRIVKVLSIGVSKIDAMLSCSNHVCCGQEFIGVAFG